MNQGTQLVGNAGEALSEIISQVNDIARMTSDIATSAEEQAIGLSEINIGVNQLDQVTQQNAAMVQDSMSRGDKLLQDTSDLSRLVSRFKVRDAAPPTFAPPDPADILAAAIADTQTEPIPAPTPARAAVGSRNDEIWEDF